MPLNDLQRAAVEYLSGPLLVLAGPGTGKTELLSRKVEYILKNTDANPENILCLTFTDAGATNMRDRLFSLVHQSAARVHIHTYHSFGSDILNMYKNYTDSPDANRYDSVIDQVKQYKIVHEIQSHLPATDILRKNQVSDIIGTIGNAKSARLTAADLKRIAKDNLEKTASINAELQEPLNNWRKGMKFAEGVDLVYRPICEILAKHISPNPQPQAGSKKPQAGSGLPQAGSKKPQTESGLPQAAPEKPQPEIPTEPAAYLYELNALIEAEEAKEKPSISPLTKWKDKNLEIDPDGKYRLANVIANKKLLSLASIMEKYDAYLAEHGLYDFADMIEGAISALKNDGGFHATLSERFQYILLDEFQDTNPSQAEIVHLLTDYEKPAVMAVGDDDQAIFEFQGANASNLLDFQQHYDAKVITLTENYRSSKSILDFSYQINQQIANSFAKSHSIKKLLTSMRNKEFINTTKVERHEFLEASAEYAFVVDRVKTLIENGTDPSEIAIIAPKHKYLIPLLPFLESRNIPVDYEKRDNLFDDPRIHDLLFLAEFIFDLRENKAKLSVLPRLLSLPYWQIDPLVALRVSERSREKRTVLDHLEVSDDKNVQALTKFLTTLAADSFNLPLTAFLNRLLNETLLKTISDTKLTTSGLEKTTSGSNLTTSAFAQTTSGITKTTSATDLTTTTKTDYATFDLYDKLNTLKSHLVNYAAPDQPTLETLINFHRDYELAGLQLISTSPYAESKSAVHLLSAHKSKGLEFAHVFIISADNRSWGKSKGNNSFLTLPKNLTQIRHTGITDDERLRVFFVATTRAKKTLTMTNSRRDYFGKAPARLDYLAEYEDGDKIISPHLPPESNIVIQHDATANDINVLADNLKNLWLENYITPTPDLKPILEKRLATYRLTASDLVRFIDIIYAGPLAFYESTLLRAPADPTTYDQAYGNLIHATFEKVTSENLSEEDAIKFFLEAAEREPLESNQIDDLKEQGKTALKASLSAFSPILRSGRAEVDLGPEHPMLDKIPLTGRLDHIVIDEKNKTLEVYDFKTGKYREKPWNSHPTLYKYRLQLGFYKLLLNLSVSYANYKIKKAHILYVTPDASDQLVHDKVYEYNEKDDHELKSLIRAVYREITNLTFLTDPTLRLEPDQSRTFTDLKAFVKLLLDRNR